MFYDLIAITSKHDLAGLQAHEPDLYAKWTCIQRGKAKDMQDALRKAKWWGATRYEYFKHSDETLLANGYRVDWRPSHPNAQKGYVEQWICQLQVYESEERFNSFYRQRESMLYGEWQ